MRESENDIQDLQQLIEQSIEQAGEFLRKSFQMPDCSLEAGELVEKLAGSLTVSLSTVTKNGEPRVAPIGAVFYRGRYYIPTIESAARTRMIRHNPAVSLTQYEGNDFAVLVHGRAVVIGSNHVYYADLQQLRQQLEMSDINTWGNGDEGIYLRIEPRVLYTYLRH